MVRLEWAEIEAFDGGEIARLAMDASTQLSGNTVFRLQPHLHLLDLAYPVDDLLLHIRGIEVKNDTASNAVLNFPRPTKVRRASLPQPQRVYVAVHRLNNSVYFKRLTRDGFALLGALREGKTLEQALEASLFRRRRDVDRVGTQLREWFHDWSYLGWFAQ